MTHMMRIGKLQLSAARIFKLAVRDTVIAVALGFVGLLFYRYLRPEDLANMFLPAARAMLAGQDPYATFGFYGPPWALAPALLVAWLPDQAAGAVFAVLSLVALGVFFKVRQVKPMRAAPILMSLPVVASLMYGNLEPFVLLSLIAPRPLGMILLTMKPQLGAVLALYWLLDEFRAGGLRAVGRLLWPLALLTGLSFLAYGFWPAVWFDAAMGCDAWGWNVWAWAPWASAHPWAHAFFLGIPVTIYALWREDQDLALGAGPLVSPYMSILNLAAWVPVMARARLWIVWLLCLASWGLAVMWPL